ncbi:MAG: DUF47 family protein [Bacilli bacterium]|nr:DUF47 family protein [Bacilli bacterium]
MGKKVQSNYYFDSFPELAHFSVECGEHILEFMKNFDHEKLWEIKTSVHEIEHAADKKKHATTEKLMEEFITPIDREDILSLLTMIDDITDAVEELSLKLYLYDFKELPPDAIPFMELTLKSLRATEEALKCFPHFLDKEVIFPVLKNVIRLEEDSDTEYIKDVSALYRRTDLDALTIYKHEAFYTMLEEMSDKCREVCRFVQTIIYKNI